MSPFTEALQKLAQRGVVPADLSSSQWADVPLALRERAFFSARVQNAAYLQEIKDRVESILRPRTETRPDGSPVTKGLDITAARAELKQILTRLGYQPGENAGGIQDLSSDRRLELQLKQNVESAQGFGNFLQGQADGALDAFPAQELFRAEDREEPRNWPTRWMQAGGQIFGGRMIALKDSPVWETISAFGTPYPPFDYNSGMWVRDIARDEAIALGLLEEGGTVASSVPGFNEKLEASVKDIAPDLLASLRQSFGGQIVIEGNTARWAAAAPLPLPVIKPVVPPAPVPLKPVTPPAPAPKPVVATKQKDVPDLADIAHLHTASAFDPALRAKVIEQARARLAVENPAALPLNMLTPSPAIQKVARAGAEIVSRYVAPELVQQTGVSVKAHRGRAFCSWSGTVNIGSKTSPSTAAHEIVHAIEMQNPAVLKASAEFLLHRGAGQAPQKLSKLTGNSGYKPHEVAFDDDWKNRNGSQYAGKVYTKNGLPPKAASDIRATEVLTMGIERLHADPVEFYKNDLEWYQFTVKTLRNLATP